MKKRWLPLFLLAMLLLGGCAWGERVRSGGMDPSGQVHRPASAVTESGEQGELDEIDQMLGDLEDELRNTDTRIDIP